MRLRSKMFSSVNMRSLVFGFVIVSACLAFIFTGFGSLRFNGFGKSLDPNTAAAVGDQKIDMMEFSNYINEQAVSMGAQSWSSLPENIKGMLQNQLLQKLIQQKILLEEAEKIGWTVGDGEIAFLIRQAPAFQDPTTKKFSLERFKKYIASQHASEVDFYHSVRQQLLVQKIQNLLFLPYALPNDLARAQSVINQTEFNLEYALISPSPTHLQALESEKIKAFLSDKSNDTLLKSMFDSQKDKFSQREQIKARTILIGHKGAQRAQGEALNRSAEDAKNQIQGLRAKATSLAEFEKLASQVNDDLIAKKAQGSIGLIDNTKIDPASYLALSGLTSEKALSNVVETPFGYRLFWFEEKKPEVKRTFEEVKEQLAEQIVGRQVKAEAQTQLEKEVSEALATKNLTALAKLFSTNEISWKNVGKAFKVVDANVDPLGDAKDLASVVYSLKTSGDMVPQLVSFGDKKAVVKLLSIKQGGLEGNSPKINAFAAQEVNADSQYFTQNVVQALVRDYEKQGKIKINPALTGAGAMTSEEDL